MAVRSRMPGPQRLAAVVLGALGAPVVAATVVRTEQPEVVVEVTVTV